MGFHFNVNTSKRIEDWNAYRENIDMAFKWNRYSSIIPRLILTPCLPPLGPSLPSDRACRKNLTRVAVFGFGVPIFVYAAPLLRCHAALLALFD
jgi:hypothetical protein